LIQKVNPKSWAIIYLKFRDTSSNRFYITKIAKRDSPDSNINDRLCFNIFNGAKPFFINFSFSYLYHVEILYPIRYKMARGNLLTLHISIGLQKLNANAILTWEKQWMGGVERFAKMDAGWSGDQVSLMQLIYFDNTLIGHYGCKKVEGLVGRWRDAQ
jgi:hypothetical protein